MLRHPVLLMVVGALLTAYLIPSFTRKWQDHQRALEVRSTLASQIAASATSALMRSDETYSRRRFTRADENAWLAWRIESAAVQARLRAYLADSTLAGDWNEFVQGVQVFHLISVDRAEDPTGLACVHTLMLSTSPAARRVEETARQEAGADIEPLHPPRRVACLETDLPIDHAVRNYAEPFEYEYYLVEDELAARRTELIKRILDADVTAF